MQTLIYFNVIIIVWLISNMLIVIMFGIKHVDIYMKSKRLQPVKNKEASPIVAGFIVVTKWGWEGVIKKHNNYKPGHDIAITKLDDNIKYFINAKDILGFAYSAQFNNFSSNN